MNQERYRIRHIISRISFERGRKAEDKVYQAIFQMGEENLLPDWVWGYDIPEKIEDIKETDIWIKTDVGKLPLQIKSSQAGRDRAVREHPKIPVIVVHEYYSDQTIVELCINAISPLREKYLKERQSSFERN